MPLSIRDAAAANNQNAAQFLNPNILGLPALVYPQQQPAFPQESPGGIKSVLMGEPAAPAPMTPSDAGRMAGEAVQPPAQPSPGFFDYWGTPPAETNPDGSPKYRFFTFMNPSEEAPAASSGQTVRHPPNPTVGTLPDVPAEETPAPVPVTEPSGDGTGVSQDTMSFVKKIMDAMGYPSAPSSDNAKQAAADAYAAHEMDRTKLLAQLAFASGLTASAGGAYTDIGKGFAAAGQVYDKGHQRYLKALQTSADRYTDNQNAQYAYQAKKSGVMADLYTAGENQKLQQQKLVQEAAKERAATIDSMFKKELDTQKNEMGITDPNATADIMKRWQLSRQAGEYIPAITDVTK